MPVKITVEADSPEEAEEMLQKLRGRSLAEMVVEKSNPNLDEEKPVEEPPQEGSEGEEGGEPPETGDNE